MVPVVRDLATVPVFKEPRALAQAGPPGKLLKRICENLPCRKNHFNGQTATWLWSQSPAYLYDVCTLLYTIGRFPCAMYQVPGLVNIQKAIENGHLIYPFS